MIAVQVELELPDSLSTELVERAAAAALERQAAREADLSVVISGDDRLRALNREFLGKDVPTDVLSFPADEIDPETGRRYLGDVILSLPRAIEQAARHGHALEAELQLLVVHGVLHLLGHDHAGAEEKQRMWATQSEILESLGVPPAIVHESD